MIKRMLLMLIAAGLLVGGTIGYKLYGRRMMAAAMAAQKPPPVAVATAEAQRVAWKPALHAVGSFVSSQGIDVCAQFDAAVAKIAFESGATVAEGQLLLQQDVSTETAQLENAEAAAALAEANLSRARELRERGSATETDLDVAVAQARQTRAAVAAIRSTIEKKTVRAPFAGRLGIRQVHQGQFLRIGAAIVPLHALDPIHFNFPVPQQNAGQVTPGRALAVTVDAFPGETFAGTVTAVNPNLAEATRTLLVQATLSNRDARLQPGMFGSAALELPGADEVTTVPLAAIVYNPYGNAVYVVEAGPDGSGLVVRQQFVQTGAKRGDQIAISKGVEPGAVVVTAGQLKLRNGAAVVINNRVAVASSPTPAIEGP